MTNFKTSQAHHTAISRKELGTVFNNLFTWHQAYLSTEMVIAGNITNM